MDLTLLLAQVIGVFALISSTSMLIRRRMVIHLLDDFFHNRALTYMVGVIEVIAGLFLVLSHDQWGGTVGTIITILGWLILIEGALYLFLNRKTLDKLSRWLHQSSVYYALVVLYFALGIILTYIGFGLEIV